jgi:hypothetical protein
MKWQQMYDRAQQSYALPNGFFKKGFEVKMLRLC